MFATRQLLTAKLYRALLLCSFALLLAAPARPQAESSTADLRGVIRDQTAAVVSGATVTVRNPATNLTRVATSGDDGSYQITNLPPGSYEISVEAAGFKRASLQSVPLTVGQRADLDIELAPGQLTETVTIETAVPELVETSRTAVATTIDQHGIANLPISQRDYINFTLITSAVGRDNGRPIGPAPTTGLNFGGQRGRSNLVQVDGADNTDNSVNASRSTVSQEAVQEFQVVTNSFAPEFGRSSGGVVNVVTKSGTNNLHGNVFGFLRNRRFDARNPFAPIDNAPYTRAQYGVTVGGPLDRDRTFMFFAFEQRHRNESGFFTSNVSQGLTSSTTIPITGLGPVVFPSLTGQQVAYINGLLGTGNPQAIGAAVQYAFLASSGGATALTGRNPLPNPGSVPGLALGAQVGPRFFLTGAPVPTPTTNSRGQFIAFRPLNDLQRVFPVTDRTTFTSIRLDHLITQTNQFTFRFGYNPSTITGIQVESQNQSLGQNDFSRTGIQKLKDYSAVATLTSTLSNRAVNEARFNFGERRATFSSQNPDAVAFNISGTAFIGRELFSPVVRTETRYEYTDTLSYVAGNHTFKFGGDAAFVRIPSAVFELNFAGLFNFGGLSATTLGAFPGGDCQSTTQAGCAPAFTPVQQYGLGFPTNFIQGFGDPVSRISNTPLAGFAQDSWKVRKNLTLNYGVRYDIELTQQIAPVGFRDPLSGINLSASDVLAAQNALNVQQGFPRDKNNFAPRVALAWDVKGNSKTVVRAAYGLFYDHPLLAIAFNSDIADAAQQQQGILIPGNPAPTSLLNAVQVFQGTVCSSAINPLCPPGFNTPGVAAGAQYQFGRQRFNDQTFPGFGPVLPFTIPVSRDFVYAYANQGTLAIEHQLTKNMSLSASYLFVGAHHLPHPLDVNAPRTDLQIANFARYANRNPNTTTEALLVSGACPGPTCFFPSNLPPGATFANPLLAGDTLRVILPGFIVASNTRGVIVSPAAANFFRPSAPNYFLVQALTGLPPATFNALLAGSLRTPGVVSPFGSVNAQTSDGNSNYHALNVDLKKRLSSNFQFLASYTWAHSIDDSSDLQTLLLPQDNRNFRAERADSLFDQRHRFVFSGVLHSPDAWRNGSGLHKVFADFVVAPIFEISSGRPFNILTNQDTNNDQSNQTDRPNVTSTGALVIPAPFANGSLGRNMGITHGYSSLDLRLMRTVRLGERFQLNLIADGFNLFNRFNEASVSPFIDDVNAFNQRASNGRYFSKSTQSFDQRILQFGVKLNF